MKKKNDPITESIRLAMNEHIRFEYTTEPKTLLLSNEEAAIYWRTTGIKPKLYRVKEGFDVFTIDMPHDEALELIHGAKIDNWTSMLYNNICGTNAIYSYPKSEFTVFHENEITDEHISCLMKKGFTEDEITRETPYEHKVREIYAKIEDEEPYRYWTEANIIREIKLALDGKPSLVKLT